MDLIPRKESGLEKRGNAETYYVSLGTVGIRIIAVAYPGLVEIFGLNGASRVLRRMFRMSSSAMRSPYMQFFRTLREKRG
jgi:hypothetical protein